MDWTLTIAELQKRYSQPQIAAFCGCGQATISDLASGKSKEPRFGLGDALLLMLDQYQHEVAAEEADKAGAV